MGRKSGEISIYKIAQEAGVSASTVSRVMNRRTGVSEETRKKINEILRKYNFTPNYPPARTDRIALLLHSTRFAGYTQNAVRGAFEYADSNGLSLNIIIRGQKTTESILEQIRDLQCAGVIVIMAGAFEDHYLTLSQSGLPVIFIDDSVHLDGVGFVDNDSYSGACEAVRHLLDLGHRKIGFLHYKSPVMNHLQRMKGYENTMKAAGITPDPAWIANPKEEWPGKRLSGYLGIELTKRLLARAPELTAIMAIDDSMALGAINAIMQTGRRIPDDISLVGFDNVPESVMWYPGLTTVEHPVFDAAGLAVKSIHDYLKSPGTWTPPREILPTKLIVRNSTGPVRAG